MKVISVENENCEAVRIDIGLTYQRRSDKLWYYNYHLLDADEIKSLEAAYQKFMNPPFKVIIAKYIKDEIAVRFQIGDDIFYLRASDRSLAKQSEQLEQALNSLMEGK
jgi:hypothetical protein